MKILVAKHLGFCTGVNRAYKIALETARKKLPVFLLGSLVHNQSVMDRLEAAGIKLFNDLRGIPKDIKGYLIISAHGVPPKVMDEIKRSTSLKVIDTTCPWVNKAQILARKLTNDGYHVVIVGDRDHVEVKGLLGWAGKHSQVVENVRDLKRVNPHKKIGVIAQTTQSIDNFEDIVKGLYEKAEEVQVFNTICEATTNKQRLAVDVAKRSEIMFIIGDKKSANTRRLTALCQDTGVKTYQVESANDVDLNWLKGFDVIGVTAGASTPVWVIDDVVKKLKGRAQ